eukprot:m.106710 g.106710  ORF g.106710 m.106710 type:complete len:101 (+) comp12716_c0_seq1:1542-1844(+)
MFRFSAHSRDIDHLVRKKKRNPLVNSASGEKRAYFERQDFDFDLSASAEERVRVCAEMGALICVVPWRLAQVSVNNTFCVPLATQKLGAGPNRGACAVTK